MKILCLIAAVILTQQESLIKRVDLPDPNGGQPRTIYQMNMGRIDPVKESPKGKLEFPFVIAGYCEKEIGSGRKELRLRIFAQDRATNVDEQVIRELLRLWEYNITRLRLDHSELYNNRIVDVYLQNSGKAGGEHRFDSDDEGGVVRKVSTIYIYDIPTFTDPLEKAREVAHEYGHASLPPIGTYTDPEDWANGMLGERLYLTWLEKDIREGRLHPVDAMEVTADQLATWIRTNVVPDRNRIARQGPDPKKLAQKDRDGINEYLGLATWAQAILPERAFARSLVLTGTQKATDYAKAVLEAASEQREWKLQLPEDLKSATVWIPLGKGKVQGATVLLKKNNWAQIKPGAGSIKITNPAID